jgi:hypothetical protein
MFAPGGGAFAISDLESANGTHVTFWGAQWSKDNPTSSGSSVASFKGFAENPSTPNCGATWTTDPGNSAAPPNGPLPQFMAVIVQTDPGYQPDPGHPGTGAVVKQLC